MTDSRRKRTTIVVVVALLVVAAAFLLWFLWPRQTPVKAASVAPAKNAPEPRVGAVPISGGTVADTPPEETIPEDRKFMAYTKGRPTLVSITVEPSRVCAGQPFMVKIAAHDPDGKEDGMFTGVGDERGSPWVGNFALPGERQVLAMAFNMRGDYEQRPVDIVVNRCADQPPALIIDSTATGEGQWAFTAKLPPDAGDAAGLTYTWDFGDGSTKATTTTPYQEHDYRERPMTSTVSAFVIKVVAERKRGDDEHFEGMTSVSMTNVYAVNRNIKGIISPDIIVRSATVDADGNATIKITVRHWEDQVLAPDEFSAKKAACGMSNLQDMPFDKDALSVSRFPKGETNVEIKLPVADIGPHACAVAITMMGKTADGYPLYLNFGAAVRTNMQPRVGTEPLDLQAKDDPMAAQQLKRIQAAAKALGRDLSKPGTVITDAELRRLEGEGVIPPLSPPTPPPAP